MHPIEPLTTAPPAIEELTRAYNAGEPLVPDAVYDALEHGPDRFLGDPGGCQHSEPMLSLANVFSAEDLARWGLAANEGYAIQPKIDGVAAAIRWARGVLVQALTRGDGVSGEDITDHVKTIKGVPHALPVPIDLELRGEVFISREDFEGMDPRPANPRNGAAGALARKDIEAVAAVPLSFLVHSLPLATGLVTAWSHLPSALEGLGLGHLACRTLWVTGDQLDQEAIENLGRDRAQLPYETDGFVVKLDSVARCRTLGAVGVHPKWAVAYKFPAEAVTATVRGITTQVGRTGSLTPVFELDPVALGGTTVSRATGFNWGQLDRMGGVGVGTKVRLERAGDVIPHVVSVVEQTAGPKAQPPTSCPGCGGPVAMRGATLVCVGTPADCEPQRARAIEHFCSRGCMDIVGVGSRGADFLAKKISHISALYTLAAEELRELGPTKGPELFAAIQRSRSQPAWRWLAGLGVPGVGRTLAKVIMQVFPSFEALGAATEEQLLAIPGVGPAAASALLAAPALWPGRYITSQPEAPASSRLAGKTICITGTLSQPRAHFEALITTNGGAVASSVSKNTTHLLAGESAGSKLEKARKLGTTIISEGEFAALLQ